MVAEISRVKRRKLSPKQDKPHPTDTSHADSFSVDFSKAAATWTLEQDYEKQARKRKDLRKEPQRLPIKTRAGEVQQDVREPEEELSNSSAEPSDAEETSITEPSDADNTAVKQKSSRENTIEAKEELARIASLINEDPEEHISSLKTLTQITSGNDLTIKRLGLATQLAVYRDIIPDYRIRPLSEDDSNAKVSKEVRKHRNFEQSIVRGYQNYLKELRRITDVSSRSETRDALLVEVAISCACSLLQHVPHFNFRGELLAIVINTLAGRKRNKNSDKCLLVLASLFDSDEDGSASLEAVTLLSKMIKAKSFRIHEDTLNLFLHLRLLSEFAHAGSNTKIDKDAPDAPPKQKMAKKQQVYRSKKERKLAKERKTIEKELQEADASVSYESRDKNQAETLKQVLGVYFRVLKARVPHLTGAVLEGLVKYAHLVNQDFFGDLLEALRELVADEMNIPDENEEEQDREELDDHRDFSRESLLCVITAFGLLQGQDVAKSASALGLDLSFFIQHLYQILYPISLDPDIEARAKSTTARVADADDATPLKVNVSTMIVLLLRSLRATLLPQHVRVVPPVRLAAFGKQLMTSSLQMPEKSCTAMLGLMNDVLKTHKSKMHPQWYSEERKGDGVFDAASADFEGSNPFATTVWEGELLQLHFCPQVREGASNLYSIFERD